MCCRFVNELHDVEEAPVVVVEEVFPVVVQRALAGSFRLRKGPPVGYPVVIE